jgi:hypothetical protein
MQAAAQLSEKRGELIVRKPPTWLTMPWAEAGSAALGLSREERLADPVDDIRQISEELLDLFRIGPDWLEVGRQLSAQLDVLAQGAGQQLMNTGDGLVCRCAGRAEPGPMSIAVMNWVCASSLET